MMLRKTITVIAAAFLASAALTGCGRKENVRLVVKTPPLYADNMASGESCTTSEFLRMAGEEFARDYKKANVTLDVIEFEYTDEIKEITECFGTENSPDVLMAGYFNMASYIHGGNVVPLDDILTDELERDFTESCLAAGKVNGKTYMLPFYSLHNTVCINKELFRGCGLDRYIGEGMEIQNWSLEEWDDILASLKENLPPDVAPMGMYAKNNQGDTHLMTLLRSRGCPFFDSSGYICVNSKDGIEALKWLKSCYDNGYFPEGCENLAINDTTQLFREEKLAMYITNSSLMPKDLDIGLANFPGTGKKGISTEFITGFMAIDNGDKAKLTAAKDFIAFIYSKDELLDYEREAIPANKSVSARSKDIIPNLDIYLANSDTAVSITANNPNWQGSGTSVRAVFWQHIHRLFTGEETPEQCAAAIDDECNAAIKEGRSKGNLHD